MMKFIKKNILQVVKTSLLARPFFYLYPMVHTFCFKKMWIMVMWDQSFFFVAGIELQVKRGKKYKT